MSRGVGKNVGKAKANLNSDWEAPRNEPGRKEEGLMERKKCEGGQGRMYLRCRSTGIQWLYDS